MPADTPDEISALLAAATNAGDLDAFVELHEQDATTVVPPDGRWVNGRAEMRAALEPIFATGPIVSRRQRDGGWLIVLENTSEPPMTRSSRRHLHLGGYAEVPPRGFSRRGSIPTVDEPTAPTDRR